MIYDFETNFFFFWLPKLERGRREMKLVHFCFTAVDYEMNNNARDIKFVH